MEDLNKLKNTIEFIQQIYDEVCNHWDSLPNYYGYNQYTTQIIHMNKNRRILYDIMAYQDFLTKEENNNILKLSTNELISHVRVKQVNSVFSKLAVYLTKTIKGKKGTVAVNKCFNDLLGVRIITDNNYTYSEIKEFIDNNFSNLKCIDSSKQEYKATHIYFKKDNSHYQWELQIWYAGYVDNNLASHKQHKQAYTKWENLFKNLEGGLK